MFADMPPEQLRTYTGCSPCPADFEAYWAAALSEMRSVRQDVSLQPAEFSAPGVVCSDLFFTGVKGARIHAKYLRPESGGPHPVVLLFHGYWDNCGNWYDKLPFALSGFCVAALDVRGQGGLSQDAGCVAGNTASGHIIRGLSSPDPRDLFFRSVYLDAAELAGIVAGFDETDESRIFCMGRSQGGALALVCAALAGPVRAAAATYPFLSDFRRVCALGVNALAYRELPEYFRTFDPRHEREEEVFTRLGYIDVQNFASRIKCDILFFTGLADEVCPPSAQFAVYNRISSPKKLYVYPEYGHEEIPESYDIIHQFFLRCAGVREGKDTL